MIVDFKVAVRTPAYSVCIKKMFSKSEWCYEVIAEGCEDAYAQVKEKIFKDNNISGIKKLFYKKGFCYKCVLVPDYEADPLLDEPVISDSPTVDIPDVPVKSAEPDELDEWIKGLGD